MDTESSPIQWTLGDTPGLGERVPELALTFYPQSFPVRWSLCSTTADFCADYLAELPACTTCRDAINYVLNELVENAVKFSEGARIEVTLSLNGTELLLVVANHVGPEKAVELHKSLGELLAGDPLDLLMRRVEANAEDPENESSGLGFLTMMTDYQAKLGWRLVPAEGHSPPLLQTSARLDIAQE